MAQEADEGMRWSLSRASAEFGCARETLKRGFRQEGIDADAEDGKFTTAQICKALFGDLDGEKVRLTRAQADKVEMENRERSKELIEVNAAVDLAQRFCFAARQVIMLSELSEPAKNKILRELNRLKEIDFNQVEQPEEMKA